MKDSMLTFAYTKICSIATEVFQMPKYKQSQAGADTGNDMIQPETRAIFTEFTDIVQSGFGGLPS